LLNQTGTANQGARDKIISLANRQVYAWIAFYIDISFNCIISYKCICIRCLYVVNLPSSLKVYAHYFTILLLLLCEPTSQIHLTILLRCICYFRYMTEVRRLNLPQNQTENVYRGFRELEEKLLSPY
jgi:hypothetical protein